ncbi:hypothetical protein [Campylobacter sp.]
MCAVYAIYASIIFHRNSVLHRSCALRRNSVLRIFALIACACATLVAII